MKVPMKAFIFTLISLLFAGQSPVLSAEKPEAAVTFSIDVPDPGWKLSIVGIFEKGGKLLVIGEATHNGNMSAAVISQATSKALMDEEFAELPKIYYLLGRTWNWGKGYSPITEEERKVLIKDAETVEFSLAGSKPGKDDFIGLSLEKAQALADKHSLVHRVVMVDGKPRPATLDFRPDRLNFTVVKGKVSEVSKG